MKTQARDLALKALFQTEFTKGVPLSELNLLQDERIDRASVQIAKDLFDGTQNKMTEIDPMIQTASRQWKVSRMSSIDRNILRLATFEMCFSDLQTKPSIVIDEAIELAKKFGTSDSKSFVNGVLDQIRKEHFRE